MPNSWKTVKKSGAQENETFLLLNLGNATKNIFLLKQDGGYLLLESGGKIITKQVMTPIDSNRYLLLESGGRIILTEEIVPTPWHTQTKS